MQIIERDHFQRENMKICIFSLSPKIGGGVIVKTIKLIQYLVNKNHSVTWAFPQRKGEYPKYVKSFLEDVEIEVIEIKTLPYLRVLDSVDFYNQIKDEYDIYQVVSGYCVDGMIFSKFANNFFIWSATTLRAEKFSQKLTNIRTFKELVSYLNFFIGLRLEKYAAKKAYKIFAASTSSRSNISDELNISKDKIDILNPIIDTDYYSFSPVSSRETDEPYILFMGIFSKRKNIDLLIHSFKKLNSKNKALKLKLVGKTNGFDRHFENLIRKLKLENFIEIVGEVEDNSYYYKNAICTVLTSYEEGFGMVLAESLSCGTPVISTKSGGVSDIVIDNENGFLVNFEQNEVSKAIEELFLNKSLRETFSFKGRKHVEDNFSINSLGAKIEKEYFHYLDKKKK